MDTRNGDMTTRSDLEARKLWAALYATSVGALMVVLDTTIVNVALPTMGADLRFSGASLVWVMDAYMLTFGGFLIVGGRLGDYFGERRVFLGGVAAFTIASIACALSTSHVSLIGARGI